MLPLLLAASSLLGCRGVPDRPDARRRDTGARDAFEDPGAEDAFAPFPFDAPGLEGVDAPFDAGPGEPPCFVDVAAAAGLADAFGPYRRPPECRFDDPANDGAGDHCDAEWGLAGTAVGDANGDGHDDLFVTRIDRPPSLYLNDGAGRFTDAAATLGISLTDATAAAAFGDIEGDGDLDLYVATFGGLTHHLFLNEGARFRDVAIARGAAISSMRPLLGSSVTFGDYDGDGDLDLFVGEWRFHTVHDGPSNARLLRNRGPAMPGFFEDVTSAAGVSMENAWTGVAMPGVYVYAVAMLDLDDDGSVDLAVNGDFRTSRLFFGRGDGTFVDETRAAGVGTETNAMGASFADLDDDGDLDWLVTSIWMDFGPDWGNRLFRNDGARRFTEITREAGVLESGWAWGAVFFDHDNDRDYDLAIANGWDFAPHADDAMRLFRNEGETRFTDVAARVGIDDRSQTRGVVVFDPDEDGDLDLFVARQGAVPSLYENRCADDGAWLRVRVRGGEGALGEGLGARVTIRERSSSTPRTFVIGQSTHYQGQSERLAHFGLGDHTGSVAEVRVALPDGRSVTRTDVTSRQVLEITVP